MKRILLSAAVMLLFMAGIAAAAEGTLSLLCDTPLPKGPACEPPPPVCAPTPPVCGPTTAKAPRTVTVPVKSIVNETKMVPVTRRVVEEENYVVMEKQTGSYMEPRTRLAKRTVEVPTTKVVAQAKYKTVEPCAGTAPRVTRKVQKKVVPTTMKVTEEFEEDYMHEVKYDYNVPVTKTRKVKKNVQEYKTVSVPRTVTSMETRVVN